MRQVLLALLCGAMLFVSGCVAAQYRSSDGSEFFYFRLGPQKMKDVRLKTPTGVELEIGGQESDIDLLKLGLLFTKIDEKN